MVSTRKKRHSNTMFLSQLDDFDQDVIIGNTVSDRQENATVNIGTVDQEFTVGNSDNNPATNENLVNVKTLERFVIERIDREMASIVETVENKIEIAILTVIDSSVTLKIELSIRSINGSSRQDGTSVMAN